MRLNIKLNGHQKWLLSKFLKKISNILVEDWLKDSEDPKMIVL